MISRKKQSLLFKLIFVLISSCLLFRYLIITRKFNLINNIYFQLPFILINEKECNSVNLLLDKHLDNSYSATIIDQNGNIIGKYNEQVLRIPASNIKLFSTAYVINNVKPSDYLQTSLYKKDDFTFYILGTGDPDLSWNDIRKLLNEIDIKNEININLVEVREEVYWPNGWTVDDRNLSYGAPITLLTLNSNQNFYTDIYTIKNKVFDYFLLFLPADKIKISIVDYDEFNKNNLKLVSSVNSNNFISLITLANSISHNYTAEILYKNISNTWGLTNYEILKNWLLKKGLPIDGIYLYDASGLSRNNRVTTYFMSLFMYKMLYSQRFDDFKSSLSILGVRGTLENLLKDNKIAGQFFAKTGTLSDTFALTGYLYNDEKPLIVSIIQNSDNINRVKVFDLLEDLYEIDDCL